MSIARCVKWGKAYYTDLNIRSYSDEKARTASTKTKNFPADSDMRDVQTLLERFGFVLVRTRGSHHIFELDDGKRSSQIVFPLHGKKVKRVYVKQVMIILDQLFPSEQESDDENT